MRITDYPDLLRTKGKEPMPQAWDETTQDWTPAIDSAATLKALREALGAPADATQADPVQEATAIALLKGLLELTAMRATDQTLTQIKTALTDGTQKVALTGNLPEKASAQYTEPATTIKTYDRAAGASRMEVYVESGRVRIRTDGESCTAVTGEPLGEGFGAAWTVPSISVLFIDDAVITVVSR